MTTTEPVPGPVAARRSRCVGQRRPLPLWGHLLLLAGPHARRGVHHVAATAAGGRRRLVPAPAAGPGRGQLEPDDRDRAARPRPGSALPDRQRASRPTTGGPRAPSTRRGPGWPTRSRRSPASITGASSPSACSASSAWPRRRGSSAAEHDPDWSRWAFWLAGTAPVAARPRRCRGPTRPARLRRASPCSAPCAWCTDPCPSDRSPLLSAGSTAATMLRTEGLLLVRGRRRGTGGRRAGGPAGRWSRSLLGGGGTVALACWWSRPRAAWIHSITGGTSLHLRAPAPARRG